MEVKKAVCVLCMSTSIGFVDGMDEQLLLKPMTLNQFCYLAEDEPPAQEKKKAVFSISDLANHLLAASKVLSLKDANSKIKNSIVETFCNSIFMSLAMDSKLFSTEKEFSAFLSLNKDFKNMQSAGRSGYWFSASCYIDSRNPMEFSDFLANVVDYSQVQISKLTSEGDESVISSTYKPHIPMEVSKKESQPTERLCTDTDTELSDNDVVILSYPFTEPLRAGVKDSSGKCIFYDAEEVRFFIKRNGRNLNVSMYPSQWSPSKNCWIEALKIKNTPHAQQSSIEALTSNASPLRFSNRNYAAKTPRYLMSKWNKCVIKKIQ